MALKVNQQEAEEVDNFTYLRSSYQTRVSRKGTLMPTW